MIEVHNLCKQFDGKEILHNINALFETGKTNLIIGTSGSGKTVLLKSLIGLHTIDSGEIIYDNIPLSKMDFNAKKNLRQIMGMVFQGGALFDSMTVEENVMFPLSMFSSMSIEEKKERVNFCLNRVNLPNAHKLYPSELSGGMIKRVAIARAIAPNPKYLFCDEPTSGLDPKTAVLIDELISEITKEYNITTIINTHDMNSTLQHGEKIIFIYKGYKWWEGNKDNIMYSDNKELNEFIYSSILVRKLKSSIENESN